MKNPRGHTNIELITAAVVLLFVGFVIVMIKNPVLVLKQQHDLVRQDGVKDIMEILLEMEYRDPESFAKVLGPAAAGRSMIGSVDDCSGSYGSRCSAEVLRDDCIDLKKYTEGYIDQVPVDPLNDLFSEDLTGYYLSFENNALEVGACHPEARDEITLTKQY